MRGEVTLSSSCGILRFGQDGFVLHRLDCGAPALRDGEVLSRAVTFSAYILPEGEDAASRQAMLEKCRRRICRIVGDAAGFTLMRDGQSLRLIADTSPVFSTEPPLTGTDAAFFTVHAHSADGESAFAGETVTANHFGRRGSLVFPLAVTEQTVFATLTAAGEMGIKNPGDMPCGFQAEIVSDGGALSGFSLSLENGGTLSLTRTLAVGEVLCLDTRPGHKDATVGGESVLGDLFPQSEFFLLPPGESRLLWQGEGDGYASLTLRFTPLYY